MFCKKCGYQLDESDLFCPACGTRNILLNSSNNLSNPNVSNHNNSNKGFFEQNKIPIYIISGLLLVVCLIFGARYSKQKKNDELWKQYKMSQSSDYDYPNYNKKSSFDYSSLHKYENSTYKVGSDMPAGEYVIFATDGSGYFCLSSDSSGNSIIANDNFDYNSIITIEEGEYLKLSRCYAEPISSAGDINTKGPAMYKIGKHLKSGEYKLEAIGSSGYYCVYSDNKQNEIYDNDNFDGTTYVYVSDGQYLKLSRCRIID